MRPMPPLEGLVTPAVDGRGVRELVGAVGYNCPSLHLLDCWGRPLRIGLRRSFQVRLGFLGFVARPDDISGNCSR